MDRKGWAAIYFKLDCYQFAGFVDQFWSASFAHSSGMFEGFNLWFGLHLNVLIKIFFLLQNIRLVETDAVCHFMSLKDSWVIIH